MKKWPPFLAASKWEQLRLRTAQAAKFGKQQSGEHKFCDIATLLAFPANIVPDSQTLKRFEQSD